MIKMQEKTVLNDNNTLSNNKEVDLQANIVQKCDPNNDLVTNMTKALASLTSEAETSNTNSNSIPDNKTLESNMEMQQQQQQQQTKLNNCNSNSNQNQNHNNTQSPQTNNTHYTRPARRTANDYRFGKSIGEGSFSTVYLAKDIYNNKEVASKLFIN